LNHVIETDAAIVGAGPAGLFQVFQLGLLGIKAHVIDSLPHAGGQCIELYPDKPIYDIPATPVCTGRELIHQLLTQIAPFNAVFHWGQEVVSVSATADQRWQLHTQALAATGSALEPTKTFITKTLFIAGGVGSFQARQINLPGIEAYRARQVHYHYRTQDSTQNKTQWAGQQVLVLGGDETALQCAIELAQQPSAHRPAKVMLLHRRSVLQAAPQTLAHLEQLRQNQQLQFMVGQITGFEQSRQTDTATLTALHITDPQGHTHTVALNTVLAFLGLSPKLGPIAQWGLHLSRKQVVVDSEKFQTSAPGIFAVGDINTYPGKKKLIVCSFHEATLAAFAAASHLSPHAQVALQYTTTSTQLQQRLGVAHK
jgi:thioredoxin reductase (NADPH)